MHVVLVKQSAKQAGGLEKAALRIANAFLARGDRVTLLSTGQVTAPQGVEVHALQGSSFFRAQRLERFDAFVSSWLQNLQADVVLGLDRCRRQTHLRAGNGVHAVYLERLHALEGRLKQFARWISPLHRKLLAVEREAFEYPGLRKVIANSAMVGREILERFSLRNAKLEVIHNGVEWSEWSEHFASWPQARLNMCRELGLDPAAFHFLFVGHGYARKGLRQLLQGLALLKRSDVHLSVIGQDKHIEQYAKEARKLGLARQVHFFGARSDVLRFYQMSDALVVPSLYDPFANVTVEALSFGMSVVSSKYNGGIEVLSPATGVVIDELLDPESVAEALRAAILRPKTELRARQVRASVEHLDFPKQLAKVLQVCE